MRAAETPMTTRVYSLLLVLLTAVAAVIAWRTGYRNFDTYHLFTAGLFLVIIVVAEALDGSSPQPGL